MNYLKLSKIILLVSTITAIVFHFNNCSEAEFSNDDSKLNQLGTIIEITKYPSNHPITEATVLAYEVKDKRNIIAEVKCFLNKVEFECSDDGETITWPANTLEIDKYEVEIIGYDKNGETVATAKTDWIIFDDFEKKQFDHVISQSNIDKGKVDILFVVDNSGSMSQEQANMADRIINFLDEVKDLDWRIAVTSTDYRDFGKLYEFTGLGKFYLEKNDYSDINDAKNALAQRIQLGSQGDGNEMPIRAIEKTIAKKLDYNFFRPNVGFSVVIITDEDESNAFNDPNKTPYYPIVKPDDLIQIVDANWPQKPFFVNSLIWEPGKTCPTAYTEATIVAELSNKTGGIIGSVCSTDYTQELKDIGKQTAKVEKSVALSCLPQDIDGDGSPDVEITGNNVPNFTLNGVNVVFDTALLPGNYNFSYWCAKP